MQNEPRRLAPWHEERAHEQQRREDAADLDHKHDRVANLPERVQLEQGFDERAFDDAGVKE